MNFKRKKCKLCTTHRWKGNRKGRFKDKEGTQREKEDVIVKYKGGWINLTLGQAGIIF
jgi:hypothetical protein